MIYYFSATGNSKHVAERIAAALGDKAISIQTISKTVELKDGEVLGIVSLLTGKGCLFLYANSFKIQYLS